MSTIKTQNQLLSKEREDVFDIYYNKIEEFKLSLAQERISENNIPNYNILEKALTVLERNLDDTAELDIAKKGLSKLGNSTLIKFLKNWFDIFNQLGKRPNFILNFTYNLIAASAVLTELRKLNKVEFQKLIKYLSPTRKDKHEFLNYISDVGKTKGIVAKSSFGKVQNIESEEGLKLINFSELENVGKVDNLDENEKADSIIIHFSGYSKSFSVSKTSVETSKDLLATSIKNRYSNNAFPSLRFELLIDSQVEKYRTIINKSNILEELFELRKYPEGTSFEWELLIKVKDNDENYRANQISFLIWSISEALEKIDGVKVTLEDMGTGSRWFRLKTKIKDEVSKKEVKEVLNKSKKALESEYLDKPIEEAKKLKAEREKIEKEKEVIIDKEDAKVIQQLQVEKFKLENEALRVKVMRDKLDLINGLSQLIANGLIKNDSDIQILINDLLFIEKTGNNLKSGEDLEIIEEDQIIIIPNKTKEEGKKRENEK